MLRGPCGSVGEDILEPYFGLYGKGCKGKLPLLKKGGTTKMTFVPLQGTEVLFFIEPAPEPPEERG